MSDKIFPNVSDKITRISSGLLESTLKSCWFKHSILEKVQRIQRFQGKTGTAPGGKDQVEIAGFLKNLLQFLNVDSSKFLLNHGSMQVKGRSEGVVEVLAENICEGCCSLVNTFGEVYQDFEMVRQLLMECVQQLGDRLRSSPSVLEVVENGCVVGVLKAEILKQCDLKLEDTLIPKEEDAREIGTGAETALEEMEGESEFLLDESTPIYGNTSQDMSRILSNDNDLRHILGVNQGLMEQLREAVSAHVTRKRESTSVPPANNVMPIKESKMAEPEMSSASPNACYYCGVSMSHPPNTKRHMTCVHPAQYFSTEFPEGTTEEDVTESINRILEEGYVVGSGPRVSKGKVLCRFCGGLQSAASRRHHLLETHLSEIRSRLAPKQNNTTSVEPVRESVAQGFIGRRRRSSKRLVHTAHDGTSQARQTQFNPLKQIAGKRITRPGTLKCKLCGKVCASEKWLRGHMMHHKRRSLPTSTRQHPVPETIDMSNFGIATNSCLYCGIALVSNQGCHHHMLTVHPTDYCAPWLPPGTTPSQVDSAIDVVINETAKIVKTSRPQYYDCRLCSKVCHMSSRRLHVMDKHLPILASTLKAMSNPN